MNGLQLNWQKLSQLLGFRRLFWRIFIAFWLASLLVMFATGFVIINNFSSSEYKQRYVNDATAQAERTLWRYENEGFDPQKLASKLSHWEQKRQERGARLYPMLIIDNNNKIVYRYRIRKDNREQMLQLNVMGPSNNEYQVWIPPPEAPRIFKLVFYRLQSLQFVFILIAAALVSALLSWSIVGPLNRLGAFSRRYANQQEISNFPHKLLGRKDELGNLAQDINYMVKQTDAHVKAQRQLLHDVSHELRAPLARLQASAALIEQKMPDNRHARQINNDCGRIDGLIQQILNFSKITEDQQAAEQLELLALCQQVIDDMTVEYPTQPVSLSASADEVWLSGYPYALQQALHNLVANACKYSPPGESVELQVVLEADSVIVHIRDHGPGVDQQEIHQLLQPFYRAGNQMHTQGFGLGLSITSRAIDKHHGQLQLSNHPQGGLLVTVRLPR